MSEFDDIIAANYRESELAEPLASAFTQDAPYGAETALAAEAEAYLEGYANPNPRKRVGNRHARRALLNSVHYPA